MRHNATPETSQTAPSAPRVRPGLRGDRVLGITLGVAFCLVVFVATGGVDLAANTWTEIVLVAVGVGAAIAVLIVSSQGARQGGLSLVMFGGLTVLTAVSITWSVQPDGSWLEANRTVAYFAVFGTGIALARLMPDRVAAIAGSVALAATVVGGWALLIKVFPGQLDSGDVFGRLRAPFDYWNATGLMAALGLPACVWAGARPEGSRAVRALSAPAVAILITVLMLSYSRSALLAGIVGLVVWFCVAPLRLRGAALLGLGVVGGAVLTVWALSTHALTHDHQPLAARTSAGHDFGLLLVLVLALVLAAGLAIAIASDRVVLSAERRPQLGVALICLVALVPVGGLVAAAVSARGFTGEISHVWSTLTSTKAGVGNSPSRLVQFGNSRPRYWSEGVKVGEHALLKGVGAAGYGVARTRYTTDPLIVEHAHSYPIETFADFGLIGLAVNLALLIAWGLATRETLRPPRRPPDQLQVARRTAALTLLSVVVVFGVHSTIDWTWFIPGTALPALLCAGWLAGRGPMEGTVGRPSRRPSVLNRPGTAAGIAALLVVAALSVWVIWQPLRASNAVSSAIAALSNGNAGAALTDARTAAASDPLSAEPRWELAAIYSALGQPRAARGEMLKATSLQPSNPATWSELGYFDLQHGQPRQALAALTRALELYPASVQIQEGLSQARARLGP